MLAVSNGKSDEAGAMEEPGRKPAMRASIGMRLRGMPSQVIKKDTCVIFHTKGLTGIPHMVDAFSLFCNHLHGIDFETFGAN